MKIGCHLPNLLAMSGAVALLFLGCGDSDPTLSSQPASLRLTTTRLCPLVPARDASKGTFPQPAPARVFGTDLGWTYERNGTITILFGDSWQRIDICPLQVNDDSLATLSMPPSNWPGFTAQASIPDADCPQLSFANNAAGTSFAPIQLHRWDGVLVPLGPLNTPLTAFYDGQREWGIFIVAGGQACSQSESEQAAPCPTELSAQAADLICGNINGLPLCHDPTSTKHGDASQAYYLHIAERVGPTSYTSRAMFLTNKYLNLTARTVRAFDPSNPQRNDYRPGNAALLMWGRPGFDDQGHDGEAPPYFMYHPLPLQIAGDRIVFTPRYLRGVTDGVPSFTTNQAEATPLYSGEFEPVNQAAVSFIEALNRWLMIYGGNAADAINPDSEAGRTQPVQGAMHARFASQPWGPWTAPEPILTNEQVAQDLVCGKQAPAGCLPAPTPRIRPACIEGFDPGSGGFLYGANIIDSYTRTSTASRGRGPAVDVFWNVSLWHPYTVVLIKTHIESQ